MSDRELLELAAKAAGVVGIDGVYPIARDSSGECYFWNPLTDDGDALRLAVKLKISLEFWEGFGEVWATNHQAETDSLIEPYGDDPYAATRRAIVRAAAEIGRTMG